VRECMCAVVICAVVACGCRCACACVCAWVCVCVCVCARLRSIDPRSSKILVSTLKQAASCHGPLCADTRHNGRVYSAATYTMPFLQILQLAAALAADGTVVHSKPASRNKRPHESEKRRVRTYCSPLPERDNPESPPASISSSTSFTTGC
jgi:hypothetical protein